MIVEIVWTLLAFGGLVRAVMLWREAMLDRRSLGDIANGRRLLARWQVEHAVMGILIYLCIFVAGYSAFIYRIGVIPLQVRLFVASGSLVVMLLILVVRQERDAHYRKLTLPSSERHSHVLLWSLAVVVLAFLIAGTWLLIAYSPDLF